MKSQKITVTPSPSPTLRSAPNNLPVAQATDLPSGGCSQPTRHSAPRVQRADLDPLTREVLEGIERMEKWHHALATGEDPTPYDDPPEDRDDDTEEPSTAEYEDDDEQDREDCEDQEPTDEGDL